MLFVNNYKQKNIILSLILILPILLAGCNGESGEGGNSQPTSQPTHSNSECVREAVDWYHACRRNPAEHGLNTEKECWEKYVVMYQHCQDISPTVQPTDSPGSGTGTGSPGGGGTGSPNDIDGDGIPNGEDPDIDGDGIPNGEDPDIDGDGIPNGEDPTPNGESTPNGSPGGTGTGSPGGGGTQQPSITTLSEKEINQEAEKCRKDLKKKAGILGKIPYLIKPFTSIVCGGLVALYQANVEFIPTIIRDSLMF